MKSLVLVLTVVLGAAPMLERALGRFPDHARANTFNLAAARVLAGQPDRAIDRIMAPLPPRGPGWSRMASGTANSLTSTWGPPGRIVSIAGDGGTCSTTTAGRGRPSRPARPRAWARPSASRRAMSSCPEAAGPFCGTHRRQSPGDDPGPT